MRTAAPPYLSFTTDVPQSSVAQTAGSAGASSGTTIGIGQLKFEGPSRYSDGRKPNVRFWLVNERWMCLMRYPPIDWIDIVVT